MMITLTIYLVSKHVTDDNHFRVYCHHLNTSIEQYLPRMNLSRSAFGGHQTQRRQDLIYPLPLRALRRGVRFFYHKCRRSAWWAKKLHLRF